VVPSDPAAGPAGGWPGHVRQAQFVEAPSARLAGTSLSGLRSARYSGSPGGFVVRGDLNPHAGEISLDLDLNSKTGEKSPDRGVHAAMLVGRPRLASNAFR